MSGNYKYSFIQYLKDLAHYIKPYNRPFWFGVFFRLTSDLARLYPAWAVSRIVQILSDNNMSDSSQTLLNIFIIWGLTAAYYSFFHNYSKYLGYQVAERASLDFYKDTIEHIFKLDFSWQEKENSGNKLKRAEKGLDGINNSIRRIFSQVIEIMVNIIGITIIFLSINKFLSVSLIFYVIVFFIVGTLLLKKAIRQERVVNKSSENLGGLTFESLNNIQTVKSLSISKSVIRLVSSNIDSLVPKIKKRIFYYQSLWGITNTFSNFFYFSIVLYLVQGVFRGTNDVGLLVLFMGYFNKIDSSAAELTDVTQDLAMVKTWISRAKYILDTPPLIENPEKRSIQSVYNPYWNELTIVKINFSYRKNRVLNNISFKIKRGEKVGIVGLSGAGKSTLFKLFLDLYENYEGNIFLDRISLKNIQRQSYIDHVAVVLQDTELFNMSLRENIKIASVRKSKNKDLINEVIKMAHLEDVVEKLPNGIDTLVGEKGIKLSGGQRQRLGIARALYRNPDILLLDEATSHLDTHSEKEIQKAILENVNKFTTIVIAHRLSTLRAMDKIIVLENGSVVEQGKFDELLEKHGVFARMWQDQKI